MGGVRLLEETQMMRFLSVEQDRQACKEEGRWKRRQEETERETHTHTHRKIEASVYLSTYREVDGWID